MITDKMPRTHQSTRRTYAGSSIGARKEEGMNSLTTPMETPTPEHVHIFACVFGLGWVASDEAHLPSIPEALARLLGVPAVRLAVVRWSGEVVAEHAFPPPELRATDGPLMLYEVEENLGGELILRLSIESSTDLTPGQTDILQRALRLLRSALACSLVGQRDRHTLGEPFASLSDREWQVCLALECSDSEKQIASALARSRHTVHSYVKSLYRKLRVQSRLQAMAQLRRAREELRRRTLEGFDDDLR
jgi:DNA-binding CsgD family transcriptional regulator